MRMRVIECGTPTALGNTINWLEGTDHRQILTQLVQAMKDFARKKKVNILIFRDFVAHELSTFGYLKKLAFRKVGILPNTAIVNQWKDFKEYEMDLKQHHRYIVRRYLRTLREQNVTVRVLSDYAHLAPELRRLWQGCYDHATEYQREILTEQFFVEMSRRMGKSSRVILFEKDGEAIGYLIGIMNKDLFQGLFAGMDYRYVRDTFLLFNIYLATIRLGIELGVKVIENGLTSISEKMNFGFKPVPMHAYMRHLSPLVNPVLSGIFSLFSESTRFENKSVFNRRFSDRIYCGIEVHLISRGKEISGTLEDLSETGAKVSSTESLKGRKLQIRFHTPLLVEDFMIRARIRWNVKHGEEYNAGVEFLDPESSKIQDLLDHLIKNDPEQEEA